LQSDTDIVEPDRLCLHRARLAARIELGEIERRTRIAPTLLRYIDQGAFERLPGGIYARSYVRAVAAVVGLDPDATLRSLSPLLQAPADATTAARRQDAPPIPLVARRDHRHRLSAVMAIERLWTSEAHEWRAYLATMIDGSILTAMHATTIVLVAFAASVPIAPLLHDVAPPLVLLCALTTLLYFLAFAGVLGQTPGDRAMQVPALDASRAVPLASAGRRALGAFLAKSSILVDVLYRAEPWTALVQVRSHE
jgi:hypothetical protein